MEQTRLLPHARDILESERFEGLEELGDDALRLLSNSAIGALLHSRILRRRSFFHIAQKFGGKLESPVKFH
jgi:hypothetical protein